MISAEFVENISYKDADDDDATSSGYTVLTSSMMDLTKETAEEIHLASHNKK